MITGLLYNFRAQWFQKMIEVQHLTKEFTLNRKQRKESGNYHHRKVTAVNNVSFKCVPGKIFGLIGPNGAGKTTILRMIATMLRPTSGTIYVQNEDCTKHPEKIRENLGFLSNNTGLYDRLTAEEMIRYYADLYGISPSRYFKRRKELYSLLNMNDFANRRIANLSSGMKQKVSIARTIIHDPSVVVFDEPTTGLDVLSSRAIVKLILRCREEGKTVIFSSHRMAEVENLCDDIAILHKGEIFFNDTFESFKGQMKSSTLEEDFIRLTVGSS